MRPGHGESLCPDFRGRPCDERTLGSETASGLGWARTNPNPVGEWDSFFRPVRDGGPGRGVSPSRPTDATPSGTNDIHPPNRRMRMFGIILTRRGSPATRSLPDLNRVILFPRWETTNPQALDEPVAGSPWGRRTEGEPTPGLRVLAPNSRKSRKADIDRARRLLAANLTYIAHPSFDEPGARDAILAPPPGSENPGPDRTPVTGDPDADSSRDVRLPSREQIGRASCRERV